MSYRVISNPHFHDASRTSSRCPHATSRPVFVIFSCDKDDVRKIHVWPSTVIWIILPFSFPLIIRLGILIQIFCPICKLQKQLLHAPKTATTNNIGVCCKRSSKSSITNIVHIILGMENLRIKSFRPFALVSLLIFFTHALVETWAFPHQCDFSFKLSRMEHGDLQVLTEFEKFRLPMKAKFRGHRSTATVRVIFVTEV